MKLGIRRYLETALEFARIERATLGGGTTEEIEIRIVAQQRRAKGGKARTEPSQEHQAEQWCRSSAGSEPGNTRNQFTKHGIGRRSRSHRGATDAGKRNRQ